MKHLFALVALSFVANPLVNQFHVTSDGQCWTEEGPAEQHARTIGSGIEARKVCTITREDAQDEIEALSKLNEGDSGAFDPKALDKMTKDALQSQCTAMGLSFEVNDTKAILIDKIKSKLADLAA